MIHFIYPIVHIASDEINRPVFRPMYLLTFLSLQVALEDHKRKLQDEKRRCADKLRRADETATQSMLALEVS